MTGVAVNHGVTKVAVNHGVTKVTLARRVDFAALGERWRDLEERASPSFFQSWTWTGCLVEERFPHPLLVEARENGRTVALALFNRHGHTRHLGQSGDPARDGIYIEYNGVLAESGREAEMTALCLSAARAGRIPFLRPRLILAGIGEQTLAAMPETRNARCYRSLKAPYIVLKNNECFLDGRSPNTRYQLRRSDRAFATLGPLALERAETVAQALECLASLKAWHQATWTARGHAGAFAAPFFERFHRALIDRGLPRREIDLLRVSAGSRAIGYLYNFRYRGRSSAYQSGFDYATAGPHAKPGLTCHHMAIRFAQGWGAERYEFLAGDDRYKRSLSDRVDTLHWVEVDARWSPRAVAQRGRNWLLRRDAGPVAAPS